MALVKIWEFRSKHKCLIKNEFNNIFEVCNKGENVKHEEYRYSYNHYQMYYKKNSI